MKIELCSKVGFGGGAGVGVCVTGVKGPLGVMGMMVSPSKVVDDETCEGGGLGGD